MKRRAAVLLGRRGMFGGTSEAARQAHGGALKGAALQELRDNFNPPPPTQRDRPRFSRAAPSRAAPSDDAPPPLDKMHELSGGGSKQPSLGGFGQTSRYDTDATSMSSQIKPFADGSDKPDDKWVSGGWVNPSDWKEQTDLLKRNQKIQYDPDDPFGRRLPEGHPGRQLPDPLRQYSIIEQYKGRNRRLEKREWEHFNKGIHLHSAPPYPELMDTHNPTENIDWGLQKGEPGPDDKSGSLYLPNPDHYIPTWTQKQRIAKLYGPSYSHYISLPAVTNPGTDDMQSERERRKRLRDSQRMAAAVQDKQTEARAHEFLAEEAKAHADPEKPEDQLLRELVDRREAMSKQRRDDEDFERTLKHFTAVQQKRGGVGLLNLWASQDALGPGKNLERWNPRLMRKLRTDGDPRLHPKLKERVFEMYIDSIDKNNSLAPWQKNLAFNMIPKAFGGPWGLTSEQLDTGPKETKKEYSAYVGTRTAVKEDVPEEDDGLDGLGL